MWVDLLRRVHRRWLRPDARNALAVALTLVQHDRWPRAIERFDEKRVVVLAPHPDDEAIGCAGAVFRHVEAGAHVTVIQLSDGRWGDRRLHDPALSDAQRLALQAELVATRRAEATAWAAAAGCTVEFLDAHDGALGPRDDWAHRLAALLDVAQPDLIYLPFVGELPEDHWQANRLLEAALAHCRGAWPRALLLRSYEVWSPVVANRVLDITAQAERKAQLLGLYASQLRDVDYRPGVAGLNTWRAMLLPQVGQGQAEAYFECSLPGWRALLRAHPQPETPPA